MAPTKPNKVSPKKADGKRNAETLVWHAMLNIHGDVFARLNRALTGNYGITLAKFDVLAQLYRSSEGLTQSDLSRELKVTDGNITGLVRRLISDGLINRETSANDRRAFVVQLTEQGKAVYLSARDLHDNLLASLFGSIGNDRLNEIDDVLKQLSQALVRAGTGESE